MKDQLIFKSFDHDTKIIVWHSEGIIFTNYNQSWHNTDELMAALSLDADFVDRIRLFNVDDEIHMWRQKGELYKRQWSLYDYSPPNYHPQNETQIIAGTSIKQKGNTYILKEDRGTEWLIPKEWIKDLDEEEFNNSNNTDSHQVIRLILELQGVYKPNEISAYTLHDYRYLNITTKHFSKQ